MRSETEIEELLRIVRKKSVISDYDIGVEQTLKWFKGSTNPYDGRAK